MVLKTTSDFTTLLLSLAMKLAWPSSVTQAWDWYHTNGLSGSLNKIFPLHLDTTPPARRGTRESECSLYLDLEFRLKCIHCTYENARL